MISIVIPSYNHERYIGESVMSALMQKTYDVDFEVIVVDDCSLDSSFNILEELEQKYSNLKVYKNSINSGVSETLNKAIELSSGEYVAILGSDDLMEPVRIYKQFKFLEGHTEFSVCSSNVTRIDSRGVVLRKQRTDPAREISADEICGFGFYFPAPGAMYRRDALLSVGLFRRDIKIEDWDLWIRLASNGYRFYFMNEFLTKYRVHENSTSSDITKMFSSILFLIESNKSFLNVRMLRFLNLIRYLKRSVFKPRVFFKILYIYFRGVN